MAATSLPRFAPITRLTMVAAWLGPASLMTAACSGGDATLTDKVAAGEAAAKRAEAAADRAEAAVRKAGSSAAPAVIEENEPEAVNVDPGQVQDLAEEPVSQQG